MCETMSIPVRMSNEVPNPLELKAIPSLFTLDVVKYGRVRCLLARRYVEMLTAAGIEPNLGLRGLSRDEQTTRTALDQRPQAVAAVA